MNLYAYICTYIHIYTLTVDLTEDFFEVEQKGQPVSGNNAKSLLTAATGGKKGGKKKK
jgi:hypothetical protein